MDLSTLRRSLCRRPLPGGGLYFLRGSPRRSEIHWAAACDRSSVDTRAIWDRLVSHLRLSATALSGTVPSAAAFAYLSAISLPGTLWWAGTHRTTTGVQCVCYLYFLYRYMQPEGLWLRPLPLPSRTAAVSRSYPQPGEGSAGATQSPPPHMHDRHHGVQCEG